jgi:hypothetical protein
VPDAAETDSVSGSLVYEITAVVGVCVGYHDAEREHWLSNPGPAQSGGRDPCELKVLFLAADDCENHLDIAPYVETAAAPASWIDAKSKRQASYKST